VLADSTDALLARAEAALSDAAATAAVTAWRARLREPLRVAIAGRVKAGKSTLLNALIGERIAPTDVRECTRVITWYRHAPGYSLAVDHRGGTIELPFRRDHGELETDLGGLAAADVDRLVVGVPTRRLQSTTYIDSPGIDALDVSAEAATRRFLTPDDERDRQADAVIYLMRHVHRDDLSFLESFHDDAVAMASPLNAIGVLSRADEVGGGRLDALASSQRIAGRLQADPVIRRLCQSVVPVCGLLAQAADELDERDVGAFRTLAGRPDLDELLVSVDAFREEAAGIPLAPGERDVLLRRYGLYGVRVSAELLRRRPEMTATAMSVALRSASGLPALMETIERDFLGRAAVLRARSALLALERIVELAPGPASAALRREVEELWAADLDLVRLHVLVQLRARHVELPDASIAAAEMLVRGGCAAARLGLDDDAPRDAVFAAAMDWRDRWHRRLELPTTSPSAAGVLRMLVRVCESLLVEHAPMPGDGSAGGRGQTHPAG
jgi:hypothetical protein